MRVAEAVSLDVVLAVEDVEPSPAATRPAGGDGRVHRYDGSLLRVARGGGVLAAVRGSLVDDDGRVGAQTHDLEVREGVVEQLDAAYVVAHKLRLRHRAAVREDVVEVFGQKALERLIVLSLHGLPRAALVRDERRFDGFTILRAPARLRLADDRAARHEQDDKEYSLHFDLFDVLVECFGMPFTNTPPTRGPDFPDFAE